MVGIPKFRGCKPCRRKKRGCDLSQPICGQCQKIGAKCIYENRPWTFVSPQQYDRPKQPLDLSPSAFLRTDRRQQLETVYLELYLPSGETPPATACTNSVVATWIPTIQYLASRDRIARLAFDSCILMALGQTQRNLGFVNHGVAMYCQALTETNRALQRSASAQEDATLATCEVLAMCERYRPHTGSEVSTKATDYQSHVQGTAKLLELRGSHRHVSEHGFVLFSNARSVIALSGITRRRRADLDTSQWYEVPWSAQGRQRTLKDKLVDAELKVAAVLEQLDQCWSEYQASNETLKICVSRCIGPAQRLRAWEIEMLRTVAGARLEEVCAEQSFGVFHLVMSYWAAFLLLSARCRPLLNRISEPTPALQALASLLPDPQVFAVNIATHAHHYFASTTGLVGPQIATFPVGAALHFFAAKTKQGLTESLYCEEVQSVLAHLQKLMQTDERARSTAEFLRSMAPDPAPQNLKGDTNNAEEHMRMAREWFKM
jgi:hypothetical protein